MQEDLDSGFAVRRIEGRMRLAVVCLGVFYQEIILKPIALKIRDSISNQHSLKGFRVSQSYACNFFSDHVYKCSSVKSEPLNALHVVLISNVLLHK